MPRDDETGPGRDLPQCSDELLRALLSTTPDLVYAKDRKGRYLFVNEAACKALGRSATELIGRDDGSVFAPDDARQIRDADEQVMETGTASVFEEELTLLGHARTFSTNKTPLRDARGAVVGVMGVSRDVTEQKRSEEAIREGERRFRLLVESSPEAIFVQANGRFAYVNDATVRLLGAERAASLLGTPVLERVHPEQRELVRARIRSLNEERATVPLLEETLLRLDGGTVVAEVSAVPLKYDGRDGALCFLRDVTERRRAEQALRKAHDSLARAQSIAHIGSWEDYLPTGELRWSDEMYRIMGLPVGATVQLNEVAGCFPPEELEKFQRAVTAAIDADAPYSTDYRIVRPDGEERFIHDEGTIIRDETGRAIWMYGTTQDITERRRIEEQLRRQQAERMEMERKLLQAQKVESLGALAGGVAHEFNNLLLAVLGNLDLALDELPPTSRARAGIEQAITATRRAAELTRQMLAYSGKGSFVVRRLDLNELARERAELFRAVTSKNASFTMELAREPCVVEGDPERLQQVLLNLINNAAEAIPGRGKIEVRIGMEQCDAARLGQSRLEVKPPPGLFAFLEVTDSGVGMDAATQERLFDPFFSTKFAGRGLGMPAVLGIVRAHHGAILVDSTPGRGSCVRVLLPACAPAQPPEPVVSAAPPAQPVAATSSPAQVLVVDDEEGVRKLCSAYVRRIGFEPLLASSGEEALELLRSNGTNVVCVILDLTMSGIGGIETFRQLRQLRPELRVILSSGYSEEGVLKEFGADRPAGFIQKPYLVATLREVIERVLCAPGG